MFTKKLFVLIVVITIVTLALTACGGTSGSAGTVSPVTNQSAVGEQTISNGINEFFQNNTQCSGIVC